MSRQPSGPYQSFGGLLRHYRESVGLSQEILAERAGLSPRGLVYLERGKHRPYPGTLIRLADALSLTPQDREVLTQALGRGGTSESPATRNVVQPPGDSQVLGQAATLSPGSLHNLPVSLSRFIGREHAQARVLELLATDRLVTLVGAGGVGKTRLALAVAESTLGRYADGVWLVELAALSDPGLVPEGVALALGVREQPGYSVLETLRNHCSGKCMLLVLDNCEHLVPACMALTSALLRAAPALSVLATSRQALGVAGERRYRVPSLSVPDPAHLPSHELAGSYEAVRLFIARAQERRDTFALTSRNARAVAEICARLDGLPLAIELAAARVSAMSVEMIAAHLHDCFRLLTTGSHDLPTRQRTLRATLDWSWGLLEARERSLLGRFSVFAGGWTLEAATAVCANDGLDYWAVLDGLDGLVNRSLAHMDENADGVVRYRLLETVRQHAGEQLIAAGKEATTRDNHLSYFLALAEQAVRAFRGPDLGTWLDRLELEHDNLRAALGWARARASGEEALQLAAALAPFWEFRGHIAEGRRWLDELLGAFQGSPRIRARALNAAGFLVMRAGDHRRALALYRESVALQRELDDMRGIAVALGNVASALVELCEFEEAGPVYAETLDLYRALGDQSGVATTFNNQAEAARGLGQYERAEALAQQSLALRREQGDLRGVAETTNNLALMASEQGRYERAAALFREGLLLSRDVGDMGRVLEAVDGLAWVAAAIGQPNWAARLGSAAEAERRRLGMPRPDSHRAYQDRAILVMREALGEEMLTAAWATGQHTSFGEAVALALKSDLAS
jgi:predicted ATPase/transcriptional regulator with XRE-family HTH domain